MTAIPLGLLAIACVTAVVDWAAVWIDSPASHRVERLAKPAALLALLAAVLVWPEAAGSPATTVRPWVVAALAASLAGDVLLLPPGRFTAGLIAFLVAHLAYLGAFVQLPGSVPWLVAGIVAAVLLAATVGRALVGAARRHGLGIPVAVYLLAICAMAVVATRTGLPPAVVGAWLFVASDSMLGWARFRASAHEPARTVWARRVAVIATYHAAQLLLVVALLGWPPA